MLAVPVGVIAHRMAISTQRDFDPGITFDIPVDSVKNLGTNPEVQIPL